MQVSKKVYKNTVLLSHFTKDSSPKWNKTFSNRILQIATQPEERIKTCFVYENAVFVIATHLNHCDDVDFYGIIKNKATTQMP